MMSRNVPYFVVASFVKLERRAIMATVAKCKPYSTRRHLSSMAEQIRERYEKRLRSTLTGSAWD